MDKELIIILKHTLNLPTRNKNSTLDTNQPFSIIIDSLRLSLIIDFDFSFCIKIPYENIAFLFIFCSYRVKV